MYTFLLQISPLSNIAYVSILLPFVLQLFVWIPVKFKMNQKQFKIFYITLSIALFLFIGFVWLLVGSTLFTASVYTIFTHPILVIIARHMIVLLVFSVLSIHSQVRILLGFTFTSFILLFLIPVNVFQYYFGVSDYLILSYLLLFGGLNSSILLNKKYKIPYEQRAINYFTTLIISNLILVYGYFEYFTSDYVIITDILLFSYGTNQVFTTTHYITVILLFNTEFLILSSYGLKNETETKNIFTKLLGLLSVIIVLFNYGQVATIQIFKTPTILEQYTSTEQIPVKTLENGLGEVYLVQEENEYYYIISITEGCFLDVYTIKDKDRDIIENTIDSNDFFKFKPESSNEPIYYFLMIKDKNGDTLEITFLPSLVD